jgi:hypothetical protein
MLGLRSLFESFYSNSGIVDYNNIGKKSFGMYRVWGVVGSPQLLGVLHVMTLFYMVYKNEKYWVILSFIAILFSTSKTAYLIIMMMGPLYLLYKKQYALFLLSLLLITMISLISLNFYFYLNANNIYGYPNFKKFIGSIIGYATTSFHISEEGRQDGLYEGPIFVLIHYFSNNPLELFFGKGLTYSFSLETSSAYDLSHYEYLTSDFYILAFFDQYGIFGSFLLIYIFFIYPMKKLLKNGDSICFVPIIFFLSMLHYPPHIPKFMMMVAAYPIYKLFLYEKK